jgi:heptosyltransferase-2
VVGIFGPTDPDATRPVTPLFTLVREPVFCSPCLLRHCPIDHRCMTRISVEQVFRAARAQLEHPAEAASREARSAGIG